MMAYALYVLVSRPNVPFPEATPQLLAATVSYESCLTLAQRFAHGPFPRDASWFIGIECVPLEHY
jgi:hypothetical protein